MTIVLFRKTLHSIFVFNKTIVHCLLVSLFFCYIPPTLATNDNIGDQQQIHQQQRQQALEQQLAPDIPDVQLFQMPTTNNSLQFPTETPCFKINSIELLGLNSVPKWLRLTYLAQQAHGHCLGSDGINLIMSALQNRLIGHGYITTRVLAPQQDLSTGKLQLLILPGKVQHITTTENSDHSILLYSSLPSREGQLLNLRDIEQGLENLQRIPTANADIQLVQGTQPGETDLLIDFHQSRHWRLAASLDDSGTVSTGRYQGGLTLYIDNLTRLGDLFYLSGGHDLQGKTERGTRNYIANYTIPYGYWSFSMTANGSNYHQTVAGRYENYRYSGDSNGLNGRLNHVIYRSERQKSTLYYDVGHRESHNYINDTQVENQYRHTAAWKLGWQQRSHLPANIIFNGDLSYQRGTRWFGAQPAQEELFGEATALSKIIRISATLEIPFQLVNQQFRYLPSYQRQISREPLTPQDRFSIGGRWSVRGFDGELNLTADNGWFLRNDLVWLTPLADQQLYWGVDYGEVSGRHSDYLLGKHLAGSVIGVRGYIHQLRLNYDTFAGLPLSKPDGFKTDPATFGFSLNWEY